MWVCEIDDVWMIVLFVEFCVGCCDVIVDVCGFFGCVVFEVVVVWLLLFVEI